MYLKYLVHFNFIWFLFPFAELPRRQITPVVMLVLLFGA